MNPALRAAPIGRRTWIVSRNTVVIGAVQQTGSTWAVTQLTGHQKVPKHQPAETLSRSMDLVDEFAGAGAR